MANKIESFIKINIVGYVKACDITDRKSIDEQFKRLDTIKSAANEQMQMVEIKTKAVNKTVEIQEPPAAPSQTGEATPQAENAMNEGGEPEEQ